LQSRSENSVLHWWATAVERSCWLVLIGGSLLRLFLRDNIPIISAFFYATPPSILVALAIILAIWHLSRKRRVLALIATIIAVVWIFSNVQSNVRLAGMRPTPEDQLVLFWNTRNGVSGWDGAIDHIRATDPSIAGFVEAWHHMGPEIWPKAFPNYQISQRSGGILVMTKGEIIEQREGDLGPNGVFLSALIRIDGRDEYRVIVVDIQSNPFRSRRQAISELSALIEMHKDERLLVMGDFNTPRDSVHFDLIRSHLTHAFETRGQGYAATWPTLLPVLDLDHVWTSAAINVSSCQHGWSLNSDHRPVVVHCH